jgi:ABC-2 type transport system ATP-binding protein
VALMNGTGVAARPARFLNCHKEESAMGNALAANWEIALKPEIRSGVSVASMEGVTKNYGDTEALRGVNLTIRAGELIALLGPNGAGKTTAVKLLLGLLPPTRGKVRVFGQDPTLPANRVRTGTMLQVGKVPETLRVKEHIDLFSSYYPRPMKLDAVLQASGLNGLENKKFADLSGGQRQRVLFALAICGNPDLLFLDEPTTGLDVEARRMVWEQVRRQLNAGKTVLLTTHYLEEADALADRIVMIHKGLIVAEGTTAEIKALTIGKKIRFRSSLTMAQLYAIPGVVAAHADRDSLEVSTREPEAVVRELLVLDRNLSGLEISGAGLEEAFLSLMKDDAKS